MKEQMVERLPDEYGWVDDWIGSTRDQCVHKMAADTGEVKMMKIKGMNRCKCQN